MIKKHIAIHTGYVKTAVVNGEPNHEYKRSLMDKNDVANPNLRFKSAASSWFPVWNQNKSIDDWYKDTETAVDRMGANLQLYYSVADDMNFTLSGGYQNSYVTSSSFGDPQVSASVREMDGLYADFIAKVKGLSLQANVETGTQDIVRGDQGFKVDNTNINIRIRPYYFTVICSSTIKCYITSRIFFS